MALLLAVIGVYGVISYGVSRRTREIGLRMALGADRRKMLRLVVGRGVALLGCGALLGAAAGAGVTRLIAALVYDVSPTESADLRGGNGPSRSRRRLGMSGARISRQSHRSRYRPSARIEQPNTLAQ